MEYAIQISGLRKNYGSTEVLKGIDFQVKKGEIFGILGVNGAGKRRLWNVSRDSEDMIPGRSEWMGKSEYSSSPPLCRHTLK